MKVPQVTTLPRSVPVQKGLPGAFTCLGNWYCLYDQNSMYTLNIIITMATKRDLRTAIDELIEAISIEAKRNFKRNT